MSACLCFTLYHGRNVQLRAKVWGPKLPWCFFFFAAWAFWLKSRALAYVRVFDQYNALNEFQYAKLRLKIFRFFCRCRGLQTLVRDCMSFASACFHVVQSCTQRTKLCHFLLCSSAAIMALSSSHACLIVRESGTDQVFSCRAWKIVRCTKWDKRNSLHAIPSPEVRHSAKMQDRERERKRKKTEKRENAGPMTYASHNPPALVWENAGKEFRLQRLDGASEVSAYVRDDACLLKSWVRTT